MSVIPNTIPAMPMDIGMMTTPVAMGRQPPTSTPCGSEWVPPHCGHGILSGNYARQGGALKGVIAEHDAINCEVGLLRQLVEKSGAMCDGERVEDEEHM
jgi:hypothetical protein